MFLQTAFPGASSLLLLGPGLTLPWSREDPSGPLNPRGLWLGLRWEDLGAGGPGPDERGGDGQRAGRQTLEGLPDSCVREAGLTQDPGPCLLLPWGCGKFLWGETLSL